MAERRRPPKCDKASIKYKYNPLKGDSIELSDFSHEKSTPIISVKHKQSCDKSNPDKSTKILSTAELISGVGQVWDYASRSLTASSSKTNLKDNVHIIPILNNSKKGAGLTTVKNNHLPVDVGLYRYISPLLQSNLKLLKVTQKMSMCKIWKGKDPTSVLDIQDEFQHIYEWRKKMILYGLKFAGQLSIQTDEDVIPTEKIISGDINNSANKSYTRNKGLASDVMECNGIKLTNDTNDVVNIRKTSLCSDYFFNAVQDTETNGNNEFKEKQHRSDEDVQHLIKKKHFEKCATDNETKKQFEKYATDDESKKQFEKCATDDKTRAELREKPHYSLAKQEHAFSGALAGVCVSLCLHPVDTVKTVIQSCRLDQKSIFYTGRSIVSERGLTGLYRGISSNVASAAPISAVYTFTYESVKGAFVPIFQKDYQSFAHCIAGGCASVATSFIFTPSERIKQQMQVGSHYQNCWNAFVGIIGNGGLRSLYTGWGAVLCRNVPHSIIKFYVYESLKQFMTSSLQSTAHAQPSPSQTLVCGGVAGSTAALFTTPFDVVKTRLQTQIPGSVSQYSSVFHAIHEIRKHEGLKGLYRGLSPRLVMYMSQGALFFASYEFFKSLFAL